MVYSAPINVVRYDNGTLIKLTASAHEFISYDFDAETKTGTFIPEAIVISAEYGGNVGYGKWQYSKTGEDFSAAADGEHGMSFTADSLTLSGDSDLFGAGNSSVIIRLVGDDERHADTITIIRTVDPLIVYDYAYTSIQQDRRKIALIASDEQLEQFRDSYTAIDKLAEVDIKADSITQTVTANYATKTYAEGQAAEAVQTAAADATSKANAARTGANADTDEKLANYTTTVNMQSMIQQTASNITQTVSQTYSTKTEAQGYATEAGSAAQSAAISAAATDATDKANVAKQEAISAAAQDATTKAGKALEDAQTYTSGQLTNYSTTSEMNSIIEQTANAITLGVSTNYATKAELNQATDGTVILQTPYSYSNGTTTFEAKVYRNGEDITAEYDAKYFEWYINSEETDDRVYRATGKTFTVSVADMKYGGVVIGRFSQTEEQIIVDDTQDPIVQHEGKEIAACRAKAVLEVQTNLYQKDYIAEKFAQISVSEDAIISEVRNNYATTVYADTVAGAAQTAAEATASADATEKAGAAEQAAKGYTDNLLVSYSTTQQMNSAITQKAGEITQTVSATYQTQAAAATDLQTAKSYADGVGTATGEAAAADATNKADAAQAAAISAAAADATSKANAARSGANSDTDTKLLSYSTTQQMNSAIQQMADSINLSVSTQYSTKAEAQGYASAAEAAAAIDATNKAAEAQAAAISAAKKDATTKANNAKTAAINTAAEDATTKATAAQSAAIAAAAADAASKASAAEANANAATDTKLLSYSTTQQMNAAITVAQNGILQTVSNSYYTQAQTVSRINTAKAEAINGAKDYVDGELEDYSTKTEAHGYADAAQAAAEATASADAQDKADAAQSAAEATAAADATNKAGEALQDAKEYTDGVLVDYSTTTEMNSAIAQSASSITSTVSATYSTKTEARNLAADAKTEAIQAAAADAQDKADDAQEAAQNYTDTQLSSYSTTAQMQSEISQTATQITSTVMQAVADDYVGKNEIISRINQTAEAISIEASKINLNGVVSANETFRIDQQGSMKATGGEIGGWSIADSIYSQISDPNNPGTEYRVRISPILSRSTNFISCYRIINGRSTMLFGLSADGSIGYYDTNGVVSAYNYNGFSHSSRENGVLYTDTEMRPGIFGFSNVDGRTLMLRGEEVLCGHIELTAATPYIDWHFDRSSSDYTTRLIETSAGNLTLYGTLNQSSDRRLKKDIAPLSEKLTRLVDKLKAKVFRYKRTPDKLAAGLIAQEVLDAEKSVGIEESVLVRGTGKEIADPEDHEKTTTDYYSVDYNALTVMLLSKVQELTDEIKDLRNEVKELRAKVKD